MPSLLCVLGLFAVSVRAEPLSAANVGQRAYIEQRLGEQIPLELTFNDEAGEPVRSSQLFTARPVLLVLAYYTCPDLCPMTLRHLTEGLNAIAPRAGDAFDVVVVSIDPADTPAAADRQRVQHLHGYKGGDALGGWHFLTATQPTIDRLREAVGFHAIYDADHRRFAHAAGIMVVAPGGTLSHYFFGVDVAPADLEAAIADARAGKATAVRQPDQQYCFTYDPSAAGRGRVVIGSLRAAGVTWVLAVAAYVGVKITREHRRRPKGVRP